MAKEEIRKIPFEDGFTWTRIVEPEVPVEGALPLVVLHGGPGFCHNYLGNLAQIADREGRTVVFYDQYGCGNSTHRPDAPAEFWTPEFFVGEFYNQIENLGFERYHVLGQSWGGMLGAEIAVTQPEGLASLSICNSPAAMDTWADAAATLIAELPKDVQEVLIRNEQAGTFENPEYIWATKIYDALHVHRTAYTPQEYLDSEAQVELDPTVYHSMNGPNEFHVIGTLKDWTIIDRLDKIQVPTIVLAGEFDEATPLTWQPYVDGIADVYPHVIKDASHCSHLEKPEEFFSIICPFLKKND